MATTLKKVAFAFLLSFLLFSCKKEKYIVTKITANTIVIDTTLILVLVITKTISPYKEKMIKEINTQISYTPKDILRTDCDLESSLGHLLADLS